MEASLGPSSSRHLISHRTSKSYFPGALIYLRYYLGVPRYTYTNYDLEKAEKEKYISGITFVSAVIIFIRYKRKPQFVKIDDEVKQMKCPYCEKQLLTNKFKRCLFCNHKLNSME